MPYGQRFISMATGDIFRLITTHKKQDRTLMITTLRNKRLRIEQAKATNPLIENKNYIKEQEKRNIEQEKRNIEQEKRNIEQEKRNIEQEKRNIKFIETLKKIE